MQACKFLGKEIRQQMCGNSLLFQQRYGGLDLGVLRFYRQSDCHFVNYFVGYDSRKIFNRSQAGRARNFLARKTWIAIDITQQLVAEILPLLYLRGKPPAARSATDNHERFHVVSMGAQAAEIESQRYSARRHKYEAGHAKAPDSHNIYRGPLAQLRRHQQSQSGNGHGARDLTQLSAERTQTVRNI